MQRVRRDDLKQRGELDASRGVKLILVPVEDVLTLIEDLEFLEEKEKTFEEDVCCSRCGAVDNDIYCVDCWYEED